MGYPTMSGETWHCPVPYKLCPGAFLEASGLYPDETVLPLGPHPGSFGAERKFEVHTGVDLYCPEGTEVRAVEDGVEVGVEWFTGPDANPPCPWWLPTRAVLVEGASGVVLYGEVETHLVEGIRLLRGWLVGTVKRVLRHDKGLPTSMLHLELHDPGTTKSSHPWELGGEMPSTLRDPTPFLLRCR